MLALPFKGIALGLQLEFTHQRSGIREGLRRRGDELPFHILKLGIAGEVFPLVRILFHVIEFFGPVGVANVAPVLVHDGIFLRLHPRHQDIAVFRHRGISKDWNQRDPIARKPILHAAQFRQRREHIHQADRRIHVRAFRNARPRPHERHVRSALPKGVLAPVKLFTVVVAVVAPQHNNRIVCIRPRLDGIEHAAQHGVGVGDAGQITEDRIFQRIQGFKPLVMRGAVLLRFPHGRGQILQIVGLVGR